MVGYFTLIILILMLSVVGERYKEYKVTPKFIFCILISFSGFRFMVGIDYPSYVDIYNNTIDRPGEVFVKEIGFIYIIKFLDFLNLNFQSLFLLCAILTGIYTYRFLKYFSPAIYVSILIYITIGTYYLASFNSVRQSIAIAVFAFSLTFIVKRRPVQYYIYIIMVALFAHLSVIILLPLYHFGCKTIKPLSKLVIIMGSIIASYFVEKIIAITPYIHLLVRDGYDIQRNNSVYLFLAISFMVFIFEKKVIDFKNKALFYNLNLLVLIALANAVIQESDILYAMFLRLNNYFFVGYIILTPYLIKMVKGQQQKLFCYSILIIFLLAYFSKTIVISGEHYDLVPYKVNFNLYGLH